MMATSVSENPSSSSESEWARAIRIAEKRIHQRQVQAWSAKVALRAAPPTSVEDPHADHLCCPVFLRAPFLAAAHLRTVLGIGDLDLSGDARTFTRANGKD